jgi:hypothetical protein
MKLLLKSSIILLYTEELNEILDQEELSESYGDAIFTKSFRPCFRTIKTNNFGISN